MGVKERKERERDERRDLILKAAAEIIAQDGIDSLSVRKIAARIEYSPSIIYHYFQDKEDIVNQVMQRSYRKILTALASAQTQAADPVEKVQEMSRNYINLALTMPEDYLTIMLSNSPAIVEHTGVLFRGAARKRPAVKMLCQCLQELHPSLDDQEAELAAQVLWSATFGLIIRLITEKDLEQSQKQRLIEGHLSWINRMMRGKASVDV
ncbi:MAG TPA: TetR/AcrR family transcriptional regulator [Bacillota bacterium]|nr:TetR/AcrR family transcriptional regulator [Bacillota bacterium]